MKKFMAIYMAPAAKMAEMMKNTTPEEQAAQNKSWRVWMESKSASIADHGAPLGKTKRASSSGVTDVKNDMGGYTIVQAESHEEAAKLFVDNPMLVGMPEASVEVMEIMPMPGM
jgi:hypothetical protein